MNECIRMTHLCNLCKFEAIRPEMQHNCETQILLILQALQAPSKEQFLFLDSGIKRRDKKISELEDLV